MTTDKLRQVREYLDYLERTWPELVAIGVTPGSRRPLPTRRDLSPAAAERQAQEDATDRAERRRPGWVPGAPGQPALDVTMLDTLAAVVSAAEDLASTVTQTAGVERPQHATSVFEDPRPYLLTARAWLSAAHDADARTAPWAADRLGPVVRQVAAALGEVMDGQVLDALCPWCGGRTERHPMGGARTLVVYAPSVTTGPDRSVGDQVRDAVDGPAIVCRGVNCTPPPSACGNRRGGQPAWPEREWDWLAKQLRAVRDTPPVMAGL